MELFKTYHAELMIALIVVACLQFLFILGLNSRLKRNNKILRSLLTGPDGEDLAALLERCLAESQRSVQRSDEVDERLMALIEQVRGCVQYLGMVRYDAYGDVSGDQSFSLAILDGYQNGVIITGLFGRHDGRCFGKAVIRGETEQALSEEEASALQMALRGGLNTLPAVSAANGKRSAKVGTK
ncbi:MAG: DUF4446 family protein [Armatimonadota bacterium]|nr:DUF4446 family protein [Armatimonadota bacterium]